MKHHPLLRLSAAIAILLCLLAILDPQRILFQLRTIDWRWLLAALICGIGANLISSLRWLQIARALELHAKPREILFSYARGVTLNALLPGATLSGDAFRAWSLRRHRGLGLATLSVILDRVCGLWGLLVLSSSAWLLYLCLPDTLSIKYGIAVLNTLIICIGVALPWLLPVATKHMAAHIPVWHQRLQQVTHWRNLVLRTLPLSLLVQACTVLALWCALHAVGLDNSYVQTVAIAAPVFLFAALPLSFGGYGTREAALVGYLVLFGAPATTAMAGALLYGISVTLQGLLFAPLLLWQSRAIPMQSTASNIPASGGRPGVK